MSKHEEHEDLSDWIGGTLGPVAFDKAAVSGAPKRVRRRGSRPSGA